MIIPDFNHENIKWVKGSHNLPECVYIYKINVPSVTAIINSEIPDPEWDEFVAKVGKEEADKIMINAGYRGTSAHVFIENFITQYNKTKDISEALLYTQTESLKILQKDNIPQEKIEEGLKLFYKFYYSNYITQFDKIFAIEFPIYSSSLFYRGKLDIFYLDKLHGYAVTDFKTSSKKITKGSVKELKYFYQLGAYANCLEEMYKNKNIIINKASILCINKQNDILQEITLMGNDLINYKEQFKTLVRQYHIKNGQDYLLK